MSRATLISRVAFGLLVLATFTAFFVAQRLKRTDPLVYAVQMKKYISPNGDGLRERGYLRFRVKRSDTVTVQVLDRARQPVRTLAGKRRLSAGVHRFFWNGRRRVNGDGSAKAVPDGAYRVRISLKRAGRTFVPDKFFVVDTTPPRLSAAVRGSHIVSALRGRPRVVRVNFSGVSPARRAEFEVYAVRGDRTAPAAVASFSSEGGKAAGSWNLAVGEFRRRKQPCFGRMRTTGRPRPAPAGSYVFVVRACDAAGNIGSSSTVLPPRRGTAGSEAGVTLRGLEVSPGMVPVAPGRQARLNVNPPPGGYRYSLRRAGGETVKRGKARGAGLRLRVPFVPGGLYTVTLTSKRPDVTGRRMRATAPLVVGTAAARRPMIVYPAIAWQAQNPVDTGGDGFADYFSNANGHTLRVGAGRTLAGGLPPRGLASSEGALSRFFAESTGLPPFAATTDLALAASPEAMLARRRALLFAGDERWITPALGLALRRWVERGGRVAFFAPDAFHRTLRIGAGTLTGPSERSERDIFGESMTSERIAPAPLVAFADTLGLLRGPTGLFTEIESSRSRARNAEVQTAGGRQPGRPVLVAYRLGRGMVIRVGAIGWQASLVRSRAAAAPPPDANVAYTTRAIIRELTR